VLRDRGISRDRLVDHLENHAIETRQLLPLINQPIYRQMFGVLDDRYPVAAHLNQHAFYIGCHPQMTDEDVDYVVDCFRAFFRNR
jgi:dTDP-4-amino-4,6-dideoxygalactose transaminase